MRVVFVHGACVRDGSWWWHRSAEALQARGVASVAPALPSCGEAGRPAGLDGPGLADDVDVVRQLLRSDSEPTIVVAHSYGGIVVAEAAAGIDSVRHLLLISSYLPGRAEPVVVRGRLAGAVPRHRCRGWHIRGSARRPRRHLPAGLPTRDRCSAPDHLARQSLSVTGAPVSAAAWLQVPSTYLVCADDRGIPAVAQREFARRAGQVVEFEAGHHPFLSQPDAVADLIVTLAA